MKEVDMYKLSLLKHKFNATNICSLLVCLLLPLIFGACTKRQPSKEVLRQELATTVGQFNEAFKNGEKALIESFIATEYLHSNGTSKAIDRTTWLNYITKRAQQIKSGEVTIQHYEMTEQDILINNNFGIVTGKVKVEGINKEGEFSNQYRVTNIWVKEAGRWKRTGFHDGKIQN